MSKRLKGKVVLITGAAQGMGESHARKCIAEGAIVIITDILEDEGKRLAEELGENAVFMKLNVTDPEDWKQVITDTVNRFGDITGLVNNAGIGIFKELQDISYAEFEKTMAINCSSVFYSLKALEPVMKNSGGSIINISSIDGLVGETGSVAYGASKFAVTGITKCAALELARYNIRVNSVHPGAVATAMAQEANEALELDENPYKTVPFKRAAKPEEISDLIVFLLSDESSYITGSEIVIDGGKICGTAW